MLHTAGLVTPTAGPVVVNVLMPVTEISVLSQYAVDDYDPAFVADFEGYYFRTGSMSNKLSQAITHSRNGNATMTDGYGPELVTNGDFSTDSDWIKGTGWSIADGVASCDGTNGQTLLQTYSGGLRDNAVYEFTFTVSNYVSGNIRPYIGGNNADLVLVTGNGTYRALSASGTANDFVGFQSSVSNFSIDNVSVREIPVIKWAPHNLLTYSEDFSNSVWLKASGITVATNTGPSPDGTQTADSVSYSAGNQLFRQITGSTVAVGETYTAAVWIRADVATTITLRILFSGGGLGQTTKSCAVTDEWTLFTVTKTVPSGTPDTARIRLISTEACTVEYWGAHVYRSDLGGMVDNPERGDSYVPTAARPFGPELVTNGTFDSGLTDWTTSVSPGASVSVVSGEVVLTPDGSTGFSAKLRQDLGLTSGKVYLVEFDVVSVTSVCSISLGGEGVITRQYDFSTTGRKSVPLTAAGGWLNINTTFSSSACTLDNISVRESSVDPSAASYLPRVGHHVYNGDAWVNEGLLHESESRTNLVTYSKIGSGGSLVTGWSGNASTFSALLSSAPDGSTDGIKVTTTGNSGLNLFSLISGLTIGQTYTASMWLRGTAGDQVYFVAEDAAAAQELVTLTGEWQRVSKTYTATSTSQYIGCELFNRSGGAHLPNVTFEAWGAQYEEAATPSSYIPTSGATVTRASDSLVIPSANLPWPTPQYIGDELVTNGGFDTDTDWTKGTGWSISGGQATHVAGTGSNISQSVSYGSAGTVYALSVDVVSISGGSGSIQARSGGTTTSKTISSLASGTTVTLIYVHDGLNTDVAITAGSSTNITVDNISVREINPLSVSIQMDGRMTYADDGALNSVQFMTWVFGTTYIRHYLRTDSIKTGMLYIQQNPGSDLDVVNGAGLEYTPGILVPYNIASRHGSTFLNGAVDGVALTANTTPVALPDLSATDLSLGFDYMGTIGTFRVWDQDLGDDGIVTASAPSLEPSLSLTFDGSGLSFTVLDWSE